MSGLQAKRDVRLVAGTVSSYCLRLPCRVLTLIRWAELTAAVDR